MRNPDNEPWPRPNPIPLEQWNVPPERDDLTHAQWEAVSRTDWSLDQMRRLVTLNLSGLSWLAAAKTAALGFAAGIALQQERTSIAWFGIIGLLIIPTLRLGFTLCYALLWLPLAILFGITGAAAKLLRWTERLFWYILGLLVVAILIQRMVIPAQH